MYIKKSDELFAQIEERKNNKKEIHKCLDQWIEKVYGIKNFTKFTSKFIGTPEKTIGVLCRQIPSVNTEDVICFLACRALNLDPCAISFIADGFYTHSAYKVSLARIPWIHWSKNDRLVLENQLVVKTGLKASEGRVLESIETNTGFLPEFHKGLRDSIFKKSYPIIDFSNFLNQAMIKAKNRPSFVFERDSNGWEKKKPVEEADLVRSRPPMYWWYNLYFSLFIDGSRVLLETYENPRDAKAKKVFEKAMLEIKENIGVFPLLVEIPDFSKKMFYCNRHILDSGTKAIESIGITLESDILEMLQKTAKKVINFKGCH